MSDEVSEDATEEGMIGPYQTVEDLGVGGYSRVLLAVHKDSKVKVAVKVLLSEPNKVTDSNGTETTQWLITDSKVLF